MSSDSLPLTKDGGTRIRWDDLAAFVVGLLSVEFYTGMSRAVASVFDAFLISPLQGLAAWAGDVAWMLTGRPGTLVTIGFSGTAHWIGRHPIVGFAVGFAIVLGIAFVASRVIPRG